MPFSQYLYIDSPSFSTATSVYLDPGLTICAPDGMYSDGLISRQLAGCVLLPKQTCTQCGANCNFFISAPSSTELGIYEMDVNMGSSTGAIVIRFNPYYTPDGIIVVYDGTNYNKLYSPYYGPLESAIAGVPTFIGVGTGACSIIVPGGSGTFNLYEYDGFEFINTIAESVIVNATQLDNTVSPPGPCVMVIPKPTTTPTQMNIRIYSLCEEIEWDIDVQCPEILTPYDRSELQDGTINCSSPIDLSFYRVPISLPATSILQIGDLVFQDQYGANPLPDGYYIVNSSDCPSLNDTIEVENGAIISFSFNCGA